MIRRHHYKRIRGETPELDVTTLLNLMIMLVPFLLISAVFSRVTITELNVPTRAGGTELIKPTFAIEVIVRKAGLEIANGQYVEAAFPKKDGKYDLAMLNEALRRVKEQYPEQNDATVLMEPDIEYDYMISVMDTVRGAPVKGEKMAMALFPNISIGDAP